MSLSLELQLSQLAETVPKRQSLIDLMMPLEDIPCSTNATAAVSPVHRPAWQQTLLPSEVAAEDFVGLLSTYNDERHAGLPVGFCHQKLPFIVEHHQHPFSMTVCICAVNTQPQ